MQDYIFCSKFQNQRFTHAYLLVDFSTHTQLPQNLRVYSESEKSISTLGNEYVQITNISWHVHGDERGTACEYGILHYFLEKQNNRGFYDHCIIEYAGRKWTVKECKEHIRENLGSK